MILLVEHAGRGRVCCHCQERYCAAVGNMANLPKYYEARHPFKSGTFLMPLGTEKFIDSAVRYEAKPGDLFLCNYLKCGISWLQNIVWRITHKGQAMRGKIGNYIAFLDFDGGEAVEATRPEDGSYTIIKTHFPCKWVPKHPEAKYIFIVREPKDVCVSLYHHIKGFPAYNWEDGAFDDLFDGFLKGELDVCDYFQMLNEWYEIKDEPNILFLLYEDLVTSTKDTIMKIAEFLGQKYVAELSANNFEYLGEVIQETSLRRMKEEDDKWYAVTARTTPFIRKGIIGDWKNHMSSSQAAAIDKRLKEAASGNGTDKLWLKWQQD